MKDTPDDAELLAPWYIGAMNDAPFIINAPSRPANDHPWHDTPHGPSLALLAHPLPNKRIEAIVDAHNATVNFAAARIRELEAQVDEWRDEHKTAAKAADVYRESSRKLVEERNKANDWAKGLSGAADRYAATIRELQAEVARLRADGG